MFIPGQIPPYYSQDGELCEYQLSDFESERLKSYTIFKLAIDNLSYILNFLKLRFDDLCIISNDINQTKFISSTGGAENYFANVMIGYA